MTLEVFLGNKTAWKILRLLSEAPGKGVKRTKIRLLTGSGNLALSNALSLLERFGILDKRKVGRAELYSMRPSKYYKSLLGIFEREREIFKGMTPSEITRVSKAVEVIARMHIPPKKIFLFGSRAKRTAVDGSDYDICLVFDKPPRELPKVPEEFQLHIFSENEFIPKNPLVREILEDGIEILGRD
ncbi:MAG: nucleotidyltransferase domain-containing protein [archaeon]